MTKPDLSLLLQLTYNKKNEKHTGQNATEQQNIYTVYRVQFAGDIFEAHISDHLAGRSAESRLASAWYGPNKSLKLKALEKAVEFAEAA